MDDCAVQMPSGPRPSGPTRRSLPQACSSRGFNFSGSGNSTARERPVTALTQPVLLPNIIAYKGFKALAFVGASSDTVYAVDYELNRMFWTQHLATAVPAKATAACPGGLGSITKAAVAAPAAAGGRGRGAGAGPNGGPGGRTAGAGDARWA